MTDADAAVDKRWTIYKRAGHWDDVIPADVIEGPDTYDGLEVVPAAELARVREERDDEAASAGHFKAQRDEAAADAARLRDELAEMLRSRDAIFNRMKAAEAERDEAVESRENLSAWRAAESSRADRAEARIDRAVTERRNAIVAWLRVRALLPESVAYMAADAIEREFPAPTRTPEASDGAGCAN